MFNKSSLFICAAALTFAFVSCETQQKPEPEKLATPTLSITEQTANSFTVSWNSVENAAGYAYALQDEAEQTTTNTSVTYSDLEAATYTLKVKATSGTEEWSDSDYAEISIDLTAPQLTFTFEVKDLTATSATVVCTPSDDNAPYWFDTMSKADFDSYSSDTEQLMKEVLDQLIALGEEEGLSVEETLEILLSIGQDTWTPTAMTPATDYVVYAFGMSYDGTFTSDIQTQGFTTLENGGGDVNPAIENWIGTWSATTTGKLEWYQPEGSQYVEALYHEDDPMTATFTIEQNTNDPSQLLIYGWSQVDSSLPALGLVNEAGDLDVYSNVAVGEESNGYTPTWVAFCKIGEDDYNLVTGQFPAYTFTLNGETATSTLYSDALNDGSTFSVISMEVYAIAETSYSIYGSSFPVYFLGGNITLTKEPASTKAASTLASEVNFPVFNQHKAFSARNNFVSIAE